MADFSLHLQEVSVDQCLASLKTSPTGLDSAEAARRLAEFGPNHVEEVGRESLLLRFAREFTHFFAIILWIGAALAFIADHFGPDQGMARLGVAIVGVIVINGVFSFWQEYKAQRAIAALRQLLPPRVKVQRAGRSIEIAASELVPGDIVLLEEGDFIAADCRVIEAYALRVNSATVTGESLPNGRDAEPAREQSALFAKNIVLAGTSVVAGRGRAAVYATGMRTEFGKIAHLTQTVGAVSSPLQREIARLSRIVAFLATGIGLAMFLVGQAIGLPLWESLLFAIGIIVANVPEGLLPTVTLSLTIIQILAVDLGTDMLPALALGAEKPDPEVMRRPPRARHDRLLSWRLLARAYLFLGALEAAGSMALFLIVMNGAGWRYGELPGRTDPLYLQATTACLATIVIMQVANVFLCRHPRKSSFSFSLLGNPYLLFGVAAELALIAFIVYTGTGNWLFGTAPVDSSVWPLALIAALLMVGLEEARKAWQRWRIKRP